MARVLELAADPDEPLLERVKFCGIVSSILDEFFMVRVAGLLDQVASGLSVRSPDGRTPQQTLAEIRERVTRADDRAVDALARRALPRARRRRASSSARVDDRDRRGARASSSRCSRQQIFPVLTPLAVGPGSAVPVHLRPVAQPRRARARPGVGRGAVRARQGAGGPRPLRRGRRARPAASRSRSVIAHFLRLALPGDGDRRASARSA